MTSYHSVIDVIEEAAQLAKEDLHLWWYQRSVASDTESGWWARMSQWVMCVEQWNPNYEAKIQAYEATLP